MTSALYSHLERVRDALTNRPALENLDGVVGALTDARSVVIATHINPDGDALGSAAALGLALTELGKRVRVVISQEAPEKLRPLFPEGLFEVVPDKESARGLSPVDLCVLLDTSEPERAGVFQDLFFAAGQRRACVDHHLARVKGLFDSQLVVTEAPATGSLVLSAIDRLGVPLSSDIAQALWIAIATDTGWFRFENTGPWALDDAARLAGVGLNLTELYRRLYEEYPASRARVLGHALLGIRTDLGGGFVWSALTLQAIEAEGVTLGDLDGVVDFLKAVRGAKVAALIVETERGTFKISLRAPGAGIEVESIARKFGGGGHRKAAGFRFSGTIDALTAALMSAVKEQTG